MARRVTRGSILTKILVMVCGVAGSVCLEAPVALAQHGGGHVGGAHMGGMPHVSAPPASHPPISHAPPVSHGPTARPLRPITPPVGGTGLQGYRLPPWRIHPAPPVFPVYPVYYPYPLFWGWPYYGFGWGWGWNSCWSWANCDLLWNWGLCYTPPLGYGNYVAPSSAAPPSYAYPPSEYGTERNDFPRLYLNDGTVFNVTDYWLVDGMLHFKVLDDGKIEEHVASFDQLDLQRTIDVATQRGFRFVLRNQPLEEYLKNEREPVPPERK